MKTTIEICSEINIPTLPSEKTLANPNLYAGHAFKILKPAIAELRRFEINNGLLPEYFHEHPDNIEAPKPDLSLDVAIERIKTHPFIVWINKQPGFIQAKKIIEKLGLKINGEPNSATIKNYRNTYALEFIVGTAIHYFSGEPHKTDQSIATKKKKKDIINAMKRLKHQLNLKGGLFFESESKQHLLQHLLDDLVNSESKNIYSEAVTHTNAERHQLTKRIMQSLIIVYGAKNITETSVVEITLSAVSDFYITMDKRDAHNNACEIFKHVDKEDSFKSLTVGEILAREGRRAMTF
jgi:transcriptional regulator of met regulon